MHLLKKCDYDSEKDATFKTKRIFDKTINEKLHGVQHINRKINYNDLRHYFKTKEKSPKYFTGF